MAFQNKQSKSQTTEFSEELQKQKLIQDISVLGASIEQAENRLAEYNITEKDIAEIKDIYADLEKRLAILLDTLKEKEKTLGEINSSIELGSRNLKKVDEDIQALQTKLSILSVDTAKSNSVFDSVQDKIAKANHEYGLLIGSKKEELRKIEASISDRKNEDKILSEQILNKKEFVELSHRKLEEIRSAKEITEKEHGTVSRQLSDAKENLESVKAKHKEEITRHEADLEFKSALFSVREKSLIDREGISSDKENWLIEKEKNLKYAKDELEKFYGRKINSVVF